MAWRRRFHSPLCWSEQELQELRGTTLMQARAARALCRAPEQPRRAPPPPPSASDPEPSPTPAHAAPQAARTLRARLQETWEHLKGPLQEVAASSTPAHAPRPRPLAFDDLLWAHCVFWSRGQALPVPTQPGAASQLVAQQQQQQRRHHAGAAQGIVVHEGLVPGLDFANHAGGRAGCWWEVVQHGGGGGGAQGGAQQPPRPTDTASIRLQLHRGFTARPGDELAINYGDSKSNEELLLLYGFVQQQQPQQQAERQGASPGGGAAVSPLDVVMLAVPVPPPAQWDRPMAARMELLMVRLLAPSAGPLLRL